MIMKQRRVLILQVVPEAFSPGALNCPNLDDAVAVQRLERGRLPVDDNLTHGVARF
jgi:hypothetical protein